MSNLSEFSADFLQDSLAAEGIELEVLDSSDCPLTSTNVVENSTTEAVDVRTKSSFKSFKSCFTIY